MDKKVLEMVDVGNVLFDEPLAPHSSWKIGGVADAFVRPYNIKQILNVVRYSRSENIPLIVIGNATNLLFSDYGVRGIVMKLGKNFSEIIIEDTFVHAESGTSVQSLAKKAGALGLTGLEHTVGIPATLGGLVYMNGGSQGKNIGDNVRRVTVIDRSKGFTTFSHEECHFSYRYSSLQDADNIICTVDLELSHRDQDENLNEMHTILENRKKKFPLNLPSCGSVFVSLPKHSANCAPPGRLIEDAGLKGFRIGDAQISDVHANFIVNLGHAKSQDVIDLVQLIRRRIWKINRTWLDTEIRYVKENGEIIRLHDA